VQLSAAHPSVSEEVEGYKNNFIFTCHIFLEVDKNTRFAK
jgi:hypothetical protein